MAESLYEGFELLEKELEECIQKIEKPIEVLEIGAREFTQDLLRLPKPMSKIKKAGYTHLVRTFSYKIGKNEIMIGWGKYYGPMVENGTIKMNARPHMTPLWETNKEKYYSKMIAKIGF